MNSSFSVLQNEPRYRRLVTAGLISGVGDWFNSVATLALLLRLTHTGLSVALLLAVRVIPYLFMGPIAGILADKWNRKWILVLSDFSRMIIALTFLLVHTQHDVWLIYVGTFALLLFTSLFNPARMAVVPQLVQVEHIASANALQESVSGIVLAVGSLLGGLITAAFGTGIAFIINSITFLISALLCMSIYIPKTHPVVTSVDNQNQEIHETFRFWPLLRKNRLVQSLLIMDIVWPIGGGIINVLLSVYAFKVFHMGNFGIGLMYGSLGIGFILGGMLTHRFVRFGRVTVIIGLMIEGLCQAGVSQSPNIWSASVLLIIATIGSGISNAFLNTYIMQAIQGPYLGRVYSLFGTVSSIVLSVSMMAAGIFLVNVQPRTLGLYGGILMFIAAFSGLLLKDRDPMYSSVKTKANL